MSPGPGTNSLSEGAWIRKTMRIPFDYKSNKQAWLDAFRMAKKRGTRLTIDDIEKLLPAGTHFGNYSMVYGTMPYPPECPFSSSLMRYALYLRMHQEGANVGATEAAIREAFARQEAWEADGKVPERNPRESKRSWLRRKTCWEKRQSEANELFLQRLRRQREILEPASGRSGLRVPKEHLKSCPCGHSIPARQAKDNRAVPARSSVRRASSTSRKGA